MKVQMRFVIVLVAAFAVVPAASAQGNCSDGSTGAIVAVSHTEIIDAGNELKVCFAIEGDANVPMHAVVADAFYGGEGLSPDESAFFTIPPESPFPELGYITTAGYCLGGPVLCPQFEVELRWPDENQPAANFPGQPVEFVCVFFLITDPTATAGIDVYSVGAARAEGENVRVCPDGDQGDYDGPLPVELLSFSATVNGTDIILDWETASETNNAGFEVQIRNGEDWDVLSFVAGHGTTTESQTYSYTATDLGVGTHVFRLKQIDFDGSFEYLGEIEVTEVEATIETPGTHLISSAYPNPFNPQSQFTLAVARRQHVTAELFNTLGQRIAVLFAGTVEANQVQNVTIDGAGLPSGMYVVRVNGERFSDALSVTLLK